MTKKRIAEIYQFLSAARMSRLSDEEKIQLIRLLRQMKPVATEFIEAVQEAVRQARDNQVENIQEFVDKAVSDIASEETTISPATMTPEAFDRLALSNDWTFAQIEELAEVMIKQD